MMDSSDVGFESAVRQGPAAGLKSCPESLCLEDLFGNPHPVEIDIGCGKGKFLLSRAEQEPGVNFLGVDRLAKWMKIGERRSWKRNLPNLKFMKVEVRELLEALRPGCVKTFHLYFPDPWPKRRHHKRRLVTSVFLTALFERLQPGGRIEIATDDRDYFQSIQKEIQKMDSVWEFVRESANERISFAGLSTHYESKYRAAGKDLFYLELKKP